jgi:hypothetical protein
MGHEQPWIGVDLDGTLAEYHGWSPNIGKPVPLMMERIYKWLHQGQRIKIFTARVGNGNAADEHAKIAQWLHDHSLPALEITCSKDMYCTCIYDDRCVQVIRNTGISVEIGGIA